MNLLSTPNRVNAVHININVILIKLNSLNFYLFLLILLCLMSILLVIMPLLLLKMLFSMDILILLLGCLKKRLKNHKIPNNSKLVKAHTFITLIEITSTLKYYFYFFTFFLDFLPNTKKGYPRYPK